nr:unnamed protein product [Callosobruchus chinensis]
MHTRNFLFSPQGGRSSYIKNRTIRPHLLSSGCPGPGMDCLVMYLMSRRELDYSSLASTSFP